PSDTALARRCRRRRDAVLFLCVLPPPSRCRLFPYTTLFRSHLCGLTTSESAPLTPSSTPRNSGATATAPAYAASTCNHSPSRAVDRKSTRLNSSHVKISYAVFCLKKKIEGMERRADTGAVF